MIAQVIFISISIVAIFLFIKKWKEISRNIHLGRKENFADASSARWRNVALLALGQKKMFKNPLVAVLHLFVYVGFIIVNIELLEIVLDGVLGTHRIFASLGGFYVFLINCFEVLAALVIIACVIFLLRRNIVKVTRLADKELNGWPKSDANIILITEIVLMAAFLKMNAADTLLQARGVPLYAENATGNFIISQWLHPMMSGLSDSFIVFTERACWWLHITGIYAFAIYLSYSKHLHIILAFPNAYYAPLYPQGEMKNMPEIQREVLYAMEPDKIPQDAGDAPQKTFGAKDIFDLSWKNLLDAYACTECGRCTAACPAHSTGKLLSPRLIMMKTRDRAEEAGKNINKHKTFTPDNKSLLHDYITTEELFACTTCSACVEACPVSISPLDIIYQLRRYLIMEESNAPAEWNNMNTNIENNFAPWQFSPDDREAWVSGG